MKASINTKLRSLRRMRDLSQEYMASKLEISQRAYGMIENGETKKIEDSKLNTILEIFGVSNDFFNSFEPAQALNQENTFNDIGYGYVEKIKPNSKRIELSEIKDIYEERIKDLKNEIVLLHNIIK